MTLVRVMYMCLRVFERERELEVKLLDLIDEFFSFPPVKLGLTCVRKQLPSIGCCLFVTSYLSFGFVCFMFMTYCCLYALGHVQQNSRRWYVYYSWLAISALI